MVLSWFASITRCCLSRTLCLARPQGPVIYLRVTSGEGLRGLLLPVFVGAVPLCGILMTHSFRGGDLFTTAGETEGHALASHLRAQKSARPMTHDLMKTCFSQLSVQARHMSVVGASSHSALTHHLNTAQVARVQVTHLHSNTYFARIVLAMPDKEGGATETDVDARPSDAINLAVRCGAPIYVSADVARTHGVRSSMPESGSSSSTTSGDTDTPSAESLPAAPVRLLDKTLELRMRLAVAVQESRLSDAQSLRDDIAVLLAGDSSTVRAVAAAQLIYEIEVRVFAPRVRVCSPPLTPHTERDS